MNAVRPRERTLQYRVLAALYSVAAYNRSVTSQEVSELLKLYMGKRSPRNIASRLSRYQAFVKPTEKGPPRRWMLTPAGVERLRSISGLALSAAVDVADFDTDIAFVAALQSPEFDALVAALGGESAWKDVGTAKFSHVFRTTELVTESGKRLRVVGTACTSMGLTAAAIATTHLVLQYRPRIVVMVGIAAGTRSGDKQFGDVLVADPSVDYNSGKIVVENGVRGFQPDPYPIGLNPRLRTVLNRYRSNTEMFAAIRAGWTGKVPTAANRLHVGPVGAADQVIDDASRVVEIQQHWRKLIGVEMETYGVYRACLEAPDPKPERFPSRQYAILQPKNRILGSRTRRMWPRNSRYAS
jgi:nucleoside phosphorylase